MGETVVSGSEASVTVVLHYSGEDATRVLRLVLTPDGWRVDAVDTL